jgi:hypothetical protein
MDELEDGPEVEAAPEEAEPPAPTTRPVSSPWRDLPPPSRPFAERGLMNWVEFVFRSDYPEPSEAVKRCWPYHADVVATLRGLKIRLDAAYFPPVKDREIGAAPLYRMVDWDLDLERAVPRWKDSFRPCPGPDGECSRSKPPSYSELAGPQNQAETDQAAKGAWGAVPPDLPPPMEPWEVARRIADAQTAASEREDMAEAESAADVDDILGPAQTW